MRQPVRGDKILYAQIVNVTPCLLEITRVENGVAAPYIVIDRESHNEIEPLTGLVWDGSKGYWVSQLAQQYKNGHAD